MLLAVVNLHENTFEPFCGSKASVLLMKKCKPLPDYRVFMAISNKVKKLVALALQDRIITHKERQVIVETAMQEGATFQEIDRYISDAVSERPKSYQKEQLTNCPKCGAPVPLIADECPHCGQSLYHEERSRLYV